MRGVEIHHQETPRATVKLQRGYEEEGSAHPPIGSYGPSPSGCQGLRPSQNHGQWLRPENLAMPT